jgi:hypothetical protein
VAEEAVRSNRSQLFLGNREFTGKFRRLRAETLGAFREFAAKTGHFLYAFRISEQGI